MIVYLESGGNLSGTSYADALKEDLVSSGHDVIVINGLSLMEHSLDDEELPELKDVDLDKTIVLVVGYIDLFIYDERHLSDEVINAIGNFFDENKKYEPDLIILFVTSFTNSALFDNYNDKVGVLKMRRKTKYYVIGDFTNSSVCGLPSRASYDQASNLINLNFNALQKIKGNLK